MAISIFINERSLHGQFEKYDFKNAIDTLNTLFTSIHTAKQTSNVLQNIHLGWKFNAIEKQNLEQSLLTLPPNTRQQWIKNTQRDLKIKNWQDNQLHDDKNDVFTINDTERVTGETLAEAAERQLQAHNCLIINFLQSNFSNKIAVCKNKKYTTELHAIENSDNWTHWLKAQKITRKFNKNNKHGENGKGAHAKNKDNDVAILYCSIAEAQTLLDTAISSPSPTDKRLYNFDTKNKKFIIFHFEGDTAENQYHGFHLEDDEAKKGLFRWLHKRFL
jgi:hypothetical protein